MKILVMGGTRFVGKALVERLLVNGYELTLFTRGNNPVSSGVKHIKGDRGKLNDLQSLNQFDFDVVIDISGRTLEDTQRVIEVTGKPKDRFIYMSSAGVYADSNNWPIDEDSELDPNSRHSGKADTEKWLIRSEIPFTSFRPTYIYGPGNYNPIERWFFSRILNDQPIPIPGDGSYITQLGHVKDLAEAIFLSLNNEVSINRIYNCSGTKGVTIYGLISSAAKACGKSINDINLISFDQHKLDSKSRKIFPIRIGHFLTDVYKLKNDLGWHPTFNLDDGLLDSYENDYILNPCLEKEFANDKKLFNL